MILLYTCVAVIPIVFWGIYSYNYLVQKTYEEQKSSAEYVVNGIDRNLNIYFQEIQKMTDNLYASSTVQGYLKNRKLSGKQSIREFQDMNLYFRDLLGGRSDVVRTTLYAMSEEVYGYYDMELRNLLPTDREIMERLEERNSKFTICNTRYQEYSNGSRYYVVTVGRQIKDLNTREVIGYLIMDIDYHAFGKMIGMENGEGEDTFLITLPDGTVGYSSASREDVFEHYWDLKTGQGKNSVTLASEFFDWEYHMLLDDRHLEERIRDLAVEMVLVCAVTFFFVLGAAIIISHNVTKPIHDLEEAMQEAEKEHYLKSVSVSASYEELSHLLKSYNGMIDEIQKLFIQKQELYKKQAEAEYQALQMQITPHFLFNSLDSINCLAQIKNEPEISEMVRGLAHIFQYNMKFDSGKTTLGDEVEHVKNFCLLQAINYQDSFTITYDIPPEFLSRPVLKFMLQPLVENAISHGMKETLVGGKIIIKAEVEAAFLIITVWDNGAGMTKEVADDLRDRLENPVHEIYQSDTTASHVGLNNVNLRLKLTYGENAGIHFVTKQGEEMAVYIRIPLSD